MSLPLHIKPKILTIVLSSGGVGGPRATVAHAMQLAGDTSVTRLAHAFPGSLRVTGAEQQVVLLLVFIMFMFVVLVAFAVY
jgi:hypothetical protein